MSQVSVADVDNLRDAYDLLVQSYSCAQEAYDKELVELSLIRESAEKDFDEANHALEEAQSCVNQLQQGLDVLKGELAAATADLAAAEADLAAAEASGSFDSDGNWEPADTSAEEAAVAEAQARVDEISEKIEQTQEKLGKAQEKLKICTERVQISRETSIIATQHCEHFIATQQNHLSAIENKVSIARARLTHAQEALNQYLASNPAAAAFEKWIHWQPTKGQVITPKDIHDRLNLSPEQQKLFAEYLYQRDPAYRNRIDIYREKFKSAQGQAEKHAVLIQASRGGSGDYAEKLISYAFRPLGTVSTQDRCYFESGDYTKIDLVVKDLNNAVILGRGDGMGASIGGSLALEVKTGHADYLYQQKDHLVFQAGGHQDSDASLVICSRDIHDLSPEKEQELRDALRDAGSPIIGMLPSKDELDGTIWKQVCEEETGKK